MRFSRSSLTTRRVCCGTSPQRVSGSLTSFHRSATVSSVSAGTLATSVSSFQCGIGLLDGGGTPLILGLLSESPQGSVYYPKPTTGCRCPGRLVYFEPVGRPHRLEA